MIGIKILKKTCVFCMLLIPSVLFANDFDKAQEAVKLNCSGISERLVEIKKIAGINTAITGTGTALSVGATAVGVVKSKIDNDLEQILSGLKGKNGDKNPASDDILTVFNNVHYETDIINRNKSKKLGNWRTVLLGGGTATNVAGAIISGKSRIDLNLENAIQICINSVEELERVIGQARLDGIDTTNATKMIDACKKYKQVDVSFINNKSNVAKISSIVGVGTGLTGTITSAMVNSDNDNGAKKNMNAAANVLAGGTAMASGVATVFSATQISAIKKIIDISVECKGAL